MHPDFVINVGDTIEGGNDELAESQWRDLRSVWQRYGHFRCTLRRATMTSVRTIAAGVPEGDGPAELLQLNYQDAHFTCSTIRAAST